MAGLTLPEAIPPMRRKMNAGGNDARERTRRACGTEVVRMRMNGVVERLYMVAWCWL